MIRSRTVLLASALLVAVLVLSGAPALVSAQTATTTSIAPTTSTTSTTNDPTSETAPVLELTPYGSTPPGESESSDSSNTGQKVVLFAAAILLPLAGIAFLVWYARRMMKAAEARAKARTATRSNDDEADGPDES